MNTLGGTLTWIIWCFTIVSRCGSETLMLATNGGVKILEPVTSGLTTVHEHPTTSVDFRFNKRDLYFISNNQILYSYYSEYSSTHADPIPIISGHHRLTSLAVDWWRFKLYYTDSDVTTSVIYEAALLGNTVSPLAVVYGTTVTDLAIDVYDRKYFYIKDGIVHVSSLDLKESPAHHPAFSFTSDPFKVARVAVDHHNRQVYVVGYDSEHLQWRLLSTDYNNSDSVLMFNGPELAQPLALGVFDGEVLWGSSADGRYTIYSCRLNPACDIDHLKIVYQTDQVINDVKWYNALVQTPDPGTACEELLCSHNCSVVTPYVVKCTCPSGFALAPDSSICVPEADGPGKATVLLQEAERLLSKLINELMSWLTSQSSLLTVLILLVCVAMLVLLCCGLCLLSCVRTPRRARQDEVYALRETSLRRDSDR